MANCQISAADDENLFTEGCMQKINSHWPKQKERKGLNSSCDHTAVVKTVVSGQTGYYRLFWTVEAFSELNIQ